MYAIAASNDEMMVNLKQQCDNMHKYMITLENSLEICKQKIQNTTKQELQTAK